MQEKITMHFYVDEREPLFIILVEFTIDQW